MSFWQIIGAAWRGTFETIRRNPALFLVVLLAFIASDQLFHHFAPVLHHAQTVNPHAPRHPRATPSGAVLGLFQDIVESIIAAPLMLAVHRYVLLNETPAPFGDARRLGYFALYLLTVRLLAEVPMDIEGVLQPDSSGQITFLLIAAVILPITVRLVLTYPGAALEQQAPLRDSWDRSRGHWWYITSIMFCGGLPLIIVDLVAIAVFFPDWKSPLPSIRLELLSFFMTASSVLYIAAGAALLSELYRKFGAIDMPRLLTSRSTKSSRGTSVSWSGAVIMLSLFIARQLFPASAVDHVEKILFLFCCGIFLLIGLFIAYMRLKTKRRRS